MSNFHDKLILNRYILSLFDIDSIGKKILSKKGVAIFTELKSSVNEGYTEDGNTLYLQTFLNHLYNTNHLTAEMLQAYDENIVRFTKQISEGREELITWKYFQYLSLLFTEIYLDQYFQNKVKLLTELNQFILEFNRKTIENARQDKKQKDIFQASKFELKDLNKIAFWNATGSGKTLIMHVNIKQYLHYAQKYDAHHQNKVLLITPNEALSKQHLEEFRISGIHANIFSKNTPGMFTGKEVEILEITKLTEQSGDKTVAVDSFETNNLVLIDEGHGGMSGDQWKNFRDKLSETGFAFEYSATFGQAINAAAGKKKADFTQEYSKSILFDYSYKYFYEDGYGKDYRILNLKESAQDYQRLYLTANLISFYQQILLFKDKKSIVVDFQLHKPLWVFVGGKVNAVRTENGKEVSDVLEIIYFLTEFLKSPQNSIHDIESVISNTAGLIDSKGNSIFHDSFTYLQELNRNAEAIFKGINELVFNNTTIGANLYLDNLKGADGELGLRVGNSEAYFGVVNVGDENTLYKLAVANKVLGIEKDFSGSLFKEINEISSTINLLIGSKKFSEGWSSWRVSSMGLMNVGKKEGSQIIQLFGRGVRLKGYGFSLKRSTGLDEYQKPDNLRAIRKYLRHLETLQIFGVKADYMEQFKEFLEEEGLPSNDSNWTSIKVSTIQKEIVGTERLKIIQVKESENFKKLVSLTLVYNEQLFEGKIADVDWYPKIEVFEQKKIAIANNKYSNSLSQQHFSFLDWNKIYLDILSYKADKTYFNLAISLEVLQAILSEKSWYKLFIPQDQLEFTSFSKVKLWEEIALVLLKKYIDQYYLYYRNQFSSDHVETRNLKATDENFILEYDFRLNKDEEIEQYEQKIKEVQEQLPFDHFSSIQIANDVIAFDTLMHLYKPLIYLGKNYSHLIHLSPIALDESEKHFLDDLSKYVEQKEDGLKNCEIYVLRNQSKKGLGFFIDGNNFYPDFILWILKGTQQFITFIDPKGIRNSRGISDPKIQFHKVLKNRIQPQVVNDGVFLNSFIISNTPYLNVQWKEHLSIEDFQQNNLLFQYEDKSDYIEKMMKKILE